MPSKLGSLSQTRCEMLSRVWCHTFDHCAQCLQAGSENSSEISVEGWAVTGWNSQEVIHGPWARFTQQKLHSAMLYHTILEWNWHWKWGMGSQVKLRLLEAGIAGAISSHNTKGCHWALSSLRLITQDEYWSENFPHMGVVLPIWGHAVWDKHKSGCKRTGTTKIPAVQNQLWQDKRCTVRQLVAAGDTEVQQTHLLLLYTGGWHQHFEGLCMLVVLGQQCHVPKWSADWSSSLQPQQSQLHSTAHLSHVFCLFHGFYTQCWSSNTSHRHTTILHICLSSTMCLWVQLIHSWQRSLNHQEASKMGATPTHRSPDLALCQLQGLMHHLGCSGQPDRIGVCRLLCHLLKGYLCTSQQTLHVWCTAVLQPRFWLGLCLTEIELTQHESRWVYSQCRVEQVMM